jgi:hypothetical protein
MGWGDKGGGPVWGDKGGKGRHEAPGGWGTPRPMHDEHKVSLQRHFTLIGSSMQTRVYLLLTAVPCEEFDLAVQVRVRGWLKLGLATGQGKIRLRKGGQGDGAAGFWEGGWGATPGEGGLGVRAFPSPAAQRWLLFHCTSRRPVLIAGEFCG